MRTDRKGKTWPPGLITVTGALAKKWLTSFQQEQLSTPKNGLAGACGGK